MVESIADVLTSITTVQCKYLVGCQLSGTTLINIALHGPSLDVTTITLRIGSTIPVLFLHDK